MALKNEPEITTYSSGQEPLRRVVIAPRKGEQQGGEVSRRRFGTGHRARPSRPYRREPVREQAVDTTQEIAAPVQYDDHAGTMPEMTKPEDVEERLEEEKEPPKQEIAPPVQFDEPGF